MNNKSNYIRFIILLFSAALMPSCSEDFSPKEENVKDNYILYCIFQADSKKSSFDQYAFVTKVYGVNGFDPLENTTDPFVQGANVYLSFRGTSYSFTEGAKKRADTTRYKDKEHFYRLNFPATSYDSMEVTARLPSGKTIKGKTLVPADLEIESYPEFNNGVTTKISRFLWGNQWILSWEKSSAYTYNHLFFPKVILSYYKKENEQVSRFSVEVPLRYEKNGNEQIAVYPAYTYQNSIAVDFDAIDSVMASVYKGVSETDKKNIFFESFIIEIKDFDTALSKYYSSTKGSLDPYSVRIDETIFSNIRGGLGVIGSFKTNSFVYKVKQMQLSENEKY